MKVTIKIARIRTLAETIAAMITDSGSEVVSELRVNVVLADWRLVDTMVVVSEPISTLIVNTTIRVNTLDFMQITD